MPPPNLVPIPLPNNFLRPLANDTKFQVARNYAIVAEADRHNYPTAVWDIIRIQDPSGETLNPALFFYKFCPDAETLKKNKKAYLKGWKSMAEGQPANAAQALLSRRNALLDDLQQPSATLEARVVWRMVIGLGNPNPLETSLTLHPQYGVPVVPGSAVKGLTRHGRLWDIGNEIGVFPLDFGEYTKRSDGRKVIPLQLLERLLVEEMNDADRSRIFGILQKDPAVVKGIADAGPENPVTKLDLATFTKLYSNDFRRVFGSTDSQGQVTFLDALPLPNWKYDLDVMTPHYGEYYGDSSGTIAPADWLQPNPIVFLTIGAGSSFRFDLVSADQDLAKNAKNWLINALEIYGVGGKTNTGYGEMEHS